MGCRRFAIVTVIAAGMLLASAASASASLVTLGSTTEPSGSAAVTCGSTVIAQALSDPAAPYAVPAGGGEITGWQVNTTGAVAGEPVTFAVLRRVPSMKYLVAGADTETLPSPLPAAGVATFSIASPIHVQAGDTLGLYSPSGAVHCYFHGGSTPEGGSLYPLTASGTPAAGQTLPISGGESGEGYIANEAAFLLQPQTGGGSTGGEDAGVVTAAGPAGVTARNQAYLISGVTDYGPGTNQIEFQDLIPEGSRSRVSTRDWAIPATSNRIRLRAGSSTTCPARAPRS